MSIPPYDFSGAEPQTLDEIRIWYLDVIDAIVAQRSSVLHTILSGQVELPRFAGMAESDVDNWYDDRRRELNRLVTLNLVASVEASLKVDYFRRVGLKLKDALSKAYREWHRTLVPKKQLRPDFESGGILDVLKDAQVMDGNIIGQYRECLRVRHWVGHGRYWTKPPEVDRFDPDDVYERSMALLIALPP